MSATITVIGNLGQDAEVKTLPSGKTITTLNIAYTPRNKKNDEWVDGETVWFRATVWHELPSLVYSKGAKVIVTGQLTQSTYTNKEGVEKTSLEIRAENVGITHRIQQEATSASFTAPTTHTTISSPLDLLEDLPF